MVLVVVVLLLVLVLVVGYSGGGEGFSEEVKICPIDIVSFSLTIQAKAYYREAIHHQAALH